MIARSRTFTHEFTCSSCGKKFKDEMFVDAENGPSPDEIDGQPDVCPACFVTLNEEEDARIQSVVDRETAGEITHDQAMAEIYDLADEAAQAKIDSPRYDPKNCSGY